MTTEALRSDDATVTSDTTALRVGNLHGHPVDLPENPTGVKVRRAENVLGLAVSLWLLVRYWRRVNWATFVALFSYIDIIGYLPGLVRVHQRRSATIEKPFYYAYNFTHTFLTAIPIAALLVWPDKKRPWSALAVFIHLFGDRGVLGNFTKTVGGEFEHIENDG